MPDGMLPPGYRAVLIGSALTFEELGVFAPMEESAAEGSLMLMQLDFARFPESESLVELEGKLKGAGVPGWPGYPFIGYADTTRPSVYIAWQKGTSWLPIIIGILATVVLPPLLGSLIWLILPQPVKDLIIGLIGMGMMMLVMWLMMSLTRPLTAPERPKRLEART
jgi:hypothetical protein